MKAVVQRVRNASVTVDGKVTGSIDHGLLVYLGVARGDDESDVEHLVRKITKLRIFCDEAGKMNLDVGQVGGGLLVVSQFTLCADPESGNRPSFSPAADPQTAQTLYALFLHQAARTGLEVRCGVFGAKMHVIYENEGPVTILYDTKSTEKT